MKRKLRYSDCVECMADSLEKSISLLVVEAVSSGVLSQEESENKSTEEILKMIFMNRFSTKKVSNILGSPGIGLSAVVKTVNEFNSTIDIKSK